MMDTASALAPPSGGSLGSVTSGILEAGQQLCHNLYLQSKQPIPYHQIEAALIEQTSKGKKASTAKVVEALRGLSFYTPDEQLIDVLLNVLAQHEDRKIAGAVYHFLSSAPQQLRSDGLTNQLKDVLAKEAKHTSVGRRALALRTLATLAPSDNKTIDDFLVDAISNVVLKEEEVDPQKTSRRTFRRHKTETSETERPLDQAGALLAARYRFGNTRSLIPVAIRGMFCDDPVGARHAIALCLQLAALHPVEVAEGVKDFLPQNVMRTPRPAVITASSFPGDRPNLSDTFARALFVRVCGRLAQSTEVSKDVGEAFFQALCQSVADLNERVAFEAVAALCAFPWSRISAACVLPIADEYGYKPSAKLPLAQAVVTRIVQALSDPTRSAVALHAACRTARLFARARIINSSSHVRDADGTLDVMCRSLLALLPQANNNSASSSTSSVETGRIFIEMEVMRALVWLTFPHHNTHTYANAFGHHIRANIFSSAQLADLFKELHERIEASPDMIKFATKLAYVWYSNVPEKTNADAITALWATILKLDEEFDARGRRQGEDEEESRENGDGGEDEFEDYRYSEGDQPTKAKALREVLLKHVFKMLDCQHKASQATPDTKKIREVVWRLRTRFYHFLAENAQFLSAYDPESDIEESAALKAILLRLEAAAVSGSWETRIVAAEGVAKLAFRLPALRSQVGHLFTSAESTSSSSAPSSSTKTATSSSLPDALLMRSPPVVPWVASPAVHLMELSAGLQDRGVSFLSLPLEERRAAAEISAKVKSQMNLFGQLHAD